MDSSPCINMLLVHLTLLFVASSLAQALEYSVEKRGKQGCLICLRVLPCVFPVFEWKIIIHVKCYCESYAILS